MKRIEGDAGLQFAVGDGEEAGHHRPRKDVPAVELPRGRPLSGPRGYSRSTAVRIFDLGARNDPRRILGECTDDLKELLEARTAAMTVECGSIIVHLVKVETVRIVLVSD